MLTRVDDYRFTSHGSSHAPPRRGGRVRTYKGAYISITSLCNTDVCAYCYARDQKIAMRTMPLDLFSRTLDMLQEISDFPEVYLVGGEPTVLRDLPAYLHEIERRGWTTTIYTNGSFKERQLEVLRGSAAVSRVSFHFDEFLFQRYAWLASRWDRNLRALSDHCEVSIIGVIDGPGFPFLELVDRAASYGASFTWIFATPTSGNTPYLGLHEMRALGPTVQQMLLRAMERNVKCSPDLPIPLCIFDPAFLNEHAERFCTRPPLPTIRIFSCRRPCQLLHRDAGVHCTKAPDERPARRHHRAASRARQGAQAASVVSRMRDV